MENNLGEFLIIRFCTFGYRCYFCVNSYSCCANVLSTPGFRHFLLPSLFYRSRMLWASTHHVGAVRKIFLTYFSLFRFRFPLFVCITSQFTVGFHTIFGYGFSFLFVSTVPVSRSRHPHGHQGVLQCGFCHPVQVMGQLEFHLSRHMLSSQQISLSICLKILRLGTQLICMRLGQLFSSSRAPS